MKEGGGDAAAARGGRGQGLFPQRLRARLIFFFLVVLLIPGVLVPVFTLGYLRSMFLETTLEESLMTVRQHTRLLESELEMRAVEVLMVSQMPETRRVVNERSAAGKPEALSYLIQALQSYLSKRTDVVQGVQLLNAQGMRMFRIGSDLEVDPEAVNRSGQDYFVGAMNVAAIRGQEIPVYVSHPEPRGPVYYSSLILNDEGMIAGVIVLEVEVSALVGALTENTPGRLCQVFDAEGRPLVVLRNAEGEPQPCRLEGRVSAGEKRVMLGERSGVIREDGGGGGGLLLYARARPRGQSTIQWTAVYEIPLEPILGPFQQAVGMVGVLTLGGVGLAVLLGVGFSRQMTRPLSQLAMAANDLCQGYWDTMLPETVYEDEVTELTRSFGTMCRQLRLAHEDLLKKVEDLHVSEQKQMREKERLRVTLRSIGEAVLAVDLGGRVELANARAAEMLGVEAERMRGMAVEEVLALYDQIRGEAVGGLGELAGSEGGGRQVDLLLQRRSGGALQVEVSVNAIRNAESEEIGMVVVIRDVTELRKMLLERNRLEKLQSLGVLAGGIAHDFNNLISVVMGDLSLLAEAEGIGGEHRRIAEHALQATERARKLTGQLLTFSKGGAPVKRTASLRDVLTETADFALHGTPCTCEVRVQPQLWLAEVDPEQIHQVFHNLTINAVQSMPDGGTLEIVLENAALRDGECPPLPGGRYLRVEVKDEGGGIPPENLSSIFDPYFTTKETGHGLGLSTVHSIVQGHGGLIQVESSTRGTRFTVYLPASEEQRVEAEAIRREAKPVLGRRRILVLDDDAAIRMTSSRLLQHLGQEVSTAETGREAVAAYREALEAGERFDVVILDLTLPGGKGGAAVLEELKGVDPEVVGIVSSGYSQDPVMANFREYGFCGMIQKPYTMRELRACLEKVAGE